MNIASTGLAIFILLATFALFFVKKNITLVIISGFVSGLLALFYVINMAPDVAITEAAVGSAISTIFFILALTHCLPYKIEKNKLNNIAFKVAVFLVCALIFSTLCYLALKMENYGDSSNVIHHNIAQYYILNTAKHFAIPNIVTAILGGYRGLDTLFETSVIFAAAMGVKAILSNKQK